ncbi:sensor histidine kinase [Brevundimonas lutea]|uniref:sensor histidine kinase n=1 Tax=Brevundimonas lutea TaxID=2293980 RepID=UPI0013CF175E|nr:HWE histidine kinase domain-containing protein [Brevundimonas lutea]
MPFASDAQLAAAIVNNVRAYAIVVMNGSGVVQHWLGDAEAVTGFGPSDACGRHLRFLFSEADQADGAAEREIERALLKGRAEDSRWHQRKDGRRFWANGMTLRLDGVEDVLVKIFRDETPAKRAEEQRVLLLNELNHRVKNTLATVQSVVEQTLRSASIGDALRQDLSGRIMALSRAHDVLVAQTWAGADLETLIHEMAGPHQRDPSPFAFDGPPVLLHPSQAVALALTLHELTTNAIKYGALSVSEGRVSLSWNLAHNAGGERFLTLLWRESGGPQVGKAGKAGFGTRMIRQTFADQAGGRARIDLEPDGVRCVMSLKLVDDADAPEVEDTAEGT